MYASTSSADGKDLVRAYAPASAASKWAAAYTSQPLETNAITVSARILRSIAADQLSM